MVSTYARYKTRRRELYLLLRAWCSCLDAIPALDYISLQADRTRPAVKLQEQSTRVAQYVSIVIPSPERRCTGVAVLTAGLEDVSYERHRLLDEREDDMREEEMAWT